MLLEFQLVFVSEAALQFPFVEFVGCFHDFAVHSVLFQQRDFE